MNDLDAARRKRITVPSLKQMKLRGEKITVLTAYDFPTAQALDAAGVDCLLVGDSLAMVVQGRNSTLPVTLEQMIYHGEMVARAATRALVVVDLPFMSYQINPEQAIASAGRVLKETEAAAVKLEGGALQQHSIRRLVEADIPVMAHVGMRPQAVRQLGSLGKVQRDEQRILADAKAAEEAGAFAIVLELIPQDIAQRVTAALSIPTIGIGAGPHCDGQVLVTPDLLGVNAAFTPRFLKKYADLASVTRQATEQYVAEVKAGQFPGPEHCH